MAAQRKLIELVLGELVFARHCLRARELAELHARKSFPDCRAHILAETIFLRQRVRQSHRDAAHAFHPRRDYDVHDTRHHGLRGKVHRLLR